MPLAQKLLVGAVVLWLLHAGRDVLEPFTLAVMLSFVLAPLVRRFRRWGLAQAPAALSALAVVGVLASLVGALLLAQLSAMSRELPQYESHVRQKVAVLRSLSTEHWREVRERAGRFRYSQEWVLRNLGVNQLASLDLMRMHPDAPKLTMEFLMLSLLLHFQALGYERFSLGMQIAGHLALPVSAAFFKLGYVVRLAAHHALVVFLER